jgi:hypothetical protein
MAWIRYALSPIRIHPSTDSCNRDQERTGTLPLLVSEHIKGYQERLENRPRIVSNDEVSVLECRMRYQPSSSSSTSTPSPLSKDLLEGIPLAIKSDGGEESSTGTSLCRMSMAGTKSGGWWGGCLGGDGGSFVCDQGNQRYAVPASLNSARKKSPSALHKAPTTNDSFY